MTAIYRTNRANIKVYNARGTQIETIQESATQITLNGVVTVIPNRGSCYPIGFPFVGFVKVADVAITQTTPDPPPEPEPQVPPGAWKRYFVLHDWNSPLGNPPFSVRLVAPNPEVNRIGEFNNRNNHQKVSLTSERQFFWADLIALTLYAKRYLLCDTEQRTYIGNRLGKLMGPHLAFTNSQEDGCNFVNGDFSSRQPVGLAPLICGGNTVFGKPAGKNKDGMDMVLIRSFLANEPLFPATVQILLDSRVLWATIIHSRFNVDPFPQLRGLSVPYPLITAESYYFPLAGLQEYSMDEEVKSQYYPPREYYP